MAENNHDKKTINKHSEYIQSIYKKTTYLDIFFSVLLNLHFKQMFSTFFYSELPF